MSSIFRNVKNNLQFSASTGLNVKEFQDLLAVFEKVYRPKDINPINGTVPFLTDPGEALFFVLYHLKCSPTFQVQGICFGMSDHAAHNYVDYTMPPLKAALAQKGMLANRLFDDQESFDAAFSKVADIFIDGTEIPIQRSVAQEVQKKDFSGKKKSTH